MSPTRVALFALAVALAGGAGYWAGGHKKVGAGETAGADTATAAPSGKKLLYYRNPMGLPDTSPTPKKDWMGMDYIPVYEGEDQDDGTGRISLARVQRLGVVDRLQMRRSPGPRPGGQRALNMHMAAQCDADAANDRNVTCRSGFRRAVFGKMSPTIHL